MSRSTLAKRFSGFQLRSLCLALILTSVFLLSVPVSGVYSAQVELEWDPSLSAQGYKLYYGVVSGNYTSPPIDVGNVTTYLLTNLTSPTYYITATGYDGAGNESEYSNELVCHSIASTRHPGPTDPSLLRAH